MMETDRDRDNERSREDDQKRQITINRSVVALILASIVVDGEGFEPRLGCRQLDIAETICKR
jgi:hypothetical protein